jgi:hypothetical protein
MKKMAKELDSILGGWVEEHRQRRVSGEVKGEGEQDFIDVTLSFQEEGHLSNFSTVGQLVHMMKILASSPPTRYVDYQGRI